MIEFDRPAGDILGRVVRVTLGGRVYEMPVRSIRANREWRAALDERTASLLDGLKVKGNDVAGIYEALSSQLDDLIDMLLAYDTADALPTRDEIEALEPDASLDVLAAVREVWRAANPLVATALARVATPDTGSSPPTSTSAPPTASARRPKSMTA